LTIVFDDQCSTKCRSSTLSNVPAVDARVRTPAAARHYEPPSAVNGLYAISGEHRYAKPGTYHGTVTLSTGTVPSVTADFTVHVP
jgi:hypothetical protein